ncbi:hypothetical protein CFOL_v3_24725 [Cephalotus follicularis]|uniref:DUF7795 domain-containing protein n=1 Tax=Cephalotus follicularis TaxID=3775 RepID=A0A1Q3CM01_CEPFO|nr:hypothetical protein CFOL_v3_24725 [Cephalotus follicularis]
MYIYKYIRRETHIYLARYHKRGLWAIKAKNGGVIHRHDKKLTTSAAVEKPHKFYPVDDVKKPLVNKRKHKPTKLRMGSEEGKLDPELKEKTFHIYKSFMTGVTKLEELGTVARELLSGFQQGLEILRRPPIDRTSELIEKIIKANETKRLQLYIEAGCINICDGVQSMSKLNTCLPGLRNHLSKAKSILDELECLLGDVGDKVEMKSPCLQELEMTDYATLMAIIYSMVKQDYAMQEKIVSSLNLTSSSAELEGYCLMWSLRPFVSDGVMDQAWRIFP